VKNQAKPNLALVSIPYERNRIEKSHLNNNDEIHFLKWLMKYYIKSNKKYL